VFIVVVRPLISIPISFVKIGSDRAVLLKDIIPAVPILADSLESMNPSFFFDKGAQDSIIYSI
jgi:hypothetical protein